MFGGVYLGSAGILFLIIFKRSLQTLYRPTTTPSIIRAVSCLLGLPPCPPHPNTPTPTPPPPLTRRLRRANITLSCVCRGAEQKLGGFPRHPWMHKHSARLHVCTSACDCPANQPALPPLSFRSSRGALTDRGGARLDHPWSPDHPRATRNVMRLHQP